MEQKKSGKLTGTLSNRLLDRFSDIWKLLSETTVFLSRTKEFNIHENQLRQWRTTLQIYGNNVEVIRTIRGEITELRKNLRLQGYDLSLGKQNLIIDGFRNDACLGEGFRRIVLAFTNISLFYLTGDDNHIVLEKLLEQKIQKARQAGVNIITHEKHYLWYHRRGSDLILSGADSESKDGFERFKALGEAHCLVILSGLKKLY
ncbi:hypothetical protein FACS1894130_04150 [Spirochaetia bacterium]|nr:hypothetical protein FACS1894130_04150 [Spirochaetia bacterium]